MLKANAVSKNFSRLIGSMLCVMFIATLMQAQSGDNSFSPPPQLIGQAAPAWTTQAWVNVPSLDLKQLRGRTVLLRFLNDAAASAAALNRFHQLYTSRGLTVVAIYTPTPFPTAVSKDHVREMAATHGIQFPIGLDPHWETLNRYWLDRADAELTATTFLIDSKGVIRYVQPDGNYAKDSPSRNSRREYAKLEKEIQILLKSVQ
ncbi:MAG: redoxin family protein [Acidobacteria bacterium]|nr:redoxin family protein [Acidobacteriota bacterium]